MIRTAASVTITAALFAALFSSSACSSTSTNDNNKGGTGSVLGGSGGAANAAGNTSTGGTAGNAGAAPTTCPGMPTSCVDATTAKACNAQNMVVTVNCKDDLAKEGIISNGCMTDATSSGCSLDGGTDAECWQGAIGVATCDDTVTQSDFLDIYFNCYDMDPNIRPIVTCIAGYVDEAAKMVDCAGAETCLPDDGMGGAGPDGEAGAGPGPDPGAGGAGGAP
jgi:hypothetical protein